MSNRINRLICNFCSNIQITPDHQNQYHQIIAAGDLFLTGLGLWWFKGKPMEETPIFLVEKSRLRVFPKKDPANLTPIDFRIVSARARGKLGLLLGWLLGRVAAFLCGVLFAKPLGQAVVRFVHLEEWGCEAVKIWVNYKDLTVLPHCDHGYHGFQNGNHLWTNYSG